MEEKIPWVIGAIVIIVIIVALTYSFGRQASDNLADMGDTAAGNANTIMDDAMNEFGMN